MDIVLRENGKHYWNVGTVLVIIVDKTVKLYNTLSARLIEEVRLSDDSRLHVGSRDSVMVIPEKPPESKSKASAKVTLVDGKEREGPFY